MSVVVVVRVEASLDNFWGLLLDGRDVVTVVTVGGARWWVEEFRDVKFQSGRNNRGMGRRGDGVSEGV